jgi:cytidine deaminase
MKHTLIIEYQEIEHWNLLPSDEIELVNEAFKIAKSAYAPYSKFHVGASLRMDDQSIIVGSNQENIAYPSGLCAERVALFHAGAIYPDKKIKKICVVAYGDLFEKEAWLTPCGGCRQVMAESESRQNNPIEILLVSQNNKVLKFNSVLDILPLAFGKFN